MNAFLIQGTLSSHPQSLFHSVLADFIQIFKLNPQLWPAPKHSTGRNYELNEGKLSYAFQPLGSSFTYVFSTLSR
jgi:hypothetical protein